MIPGEKSTPILLKVSLGVVKPEECNKYYKVGDRGLKQGLMNYHLCAGDVKMDTCPVGVIREPSPICLFTGQSNCSPTGRLRRTTADETTAQWQDDSVRCGRYFVWKHMRPIDSWRLHEGSTLYSMDKCRACQTRRDHQRYGNLQENQSFA